MGIDARRWLGDQEVRRASAGSRRMALAFREVKGLRILGPTDSKDRITVFSFVMENKQALDVVKALDVTGIAVRGGDLASLPLLKRMGVTAAVRASCYAYTKSEEIDQLVAELASDRRGFS